MSNRKTVVTIALCMVMVLATMGGCKNGNNTESLERTHSTATVTATSTATDTASYDRSPEIEAPGIEESAPPPSDYTPQPPPTELKLLT